MSDDKLWGGRFQQPPSALFETFSNSLHYDRRLVEEDIAGSQTFARALRQVGILTDAECAEILAAFEALREEAREESFFAGARDEDIHSLVIRKLRARIGRLADKIHTGRSRNEQVSLDTRMWLRGQIDEVTRRLIALMESLLALAERYSDAVIPGYTHTRRAQALLWPHYLLAYFEMLARDVERLCEARARANVLPLGSGALAGSAFPFDRNAMAAELGFEGITRNSVDVSADRDFVLDFLYAASMVMLHLSRLAEDWILYSGEEYGWMELGDEVTSGSSLMPQKKNPDALELIRGKTGRVVGHLVGLLMTMKGLPLAYNRDMQEDKEALFDAVDQVKGCLEMTQAVAATARLYPERAAAAASASWLVATDLAEALARRGVAFHEAHALVGRLVLHSLETGKKPADWSGEQLAAFSPHFTPEMAKLMDPREGMKTRELPGGTGPESVKAALAAARARLNEMASKLA